MKIDNIAKQLAELGHITRLEIFRLLVKAGKSGLPVGQIQTELNIPGSTLSHHISKLMSVGLVKQNREGRTLYCIFQDKELDGIINFLKEECCINENDPK